MKILFATTNPAKVRFYATRLKEKGVNLVTLKDLDITSEVEETGKTPVENAIIKATEYFKMSQIPTIAIDECLYFNDFPHDLQPGVHVRRAENKRLSDIEMITYYTDLVSKYGKNGQLSGYFRKGVALFDGKTLQTFENDAPRIFVNERSQYIDEGYPLASIQIIPQYNKFKSELTREEERTTIDIEQQQVLAFFIEAIAKLGEKIK